MAQNDPNQRAANRYGKPKAFGERNKSNLPRLILFIIWILFDELPCRFPYSRNFERATIVAVFVFVSLCVCVPCCRTSRNHTPNVHRTTRTTPGSLHTERISKTIDSTTHSNSSDIGRCTTLTKLSEMFSSVFQCRALVAFIFSLFCSSRLHDEPTELHTQFGVNGSHSSPV